MCPNSFITYPQEEDDDEWDGNERDGDKSNDDESDADGNRGDGDERHEAIEEAHEAVGEMHGMVEESHHCADNDASVSTEITIMWYLLYYKSMILLKLQDTIQKKDGMCEKIFKKHSDRA